MICTKVLSDNSDLQLYLIFFIFLNETSLLMMVFLWCGYLNAHSQVSDDIWQLKDFKNDEKCFLFHLKALFVVKICKFLSWLFDHVEKRLDSKNKINFEIYDVTAWLTNNCNTHIYQYLKSKSNQATKFGQLIECYTRNIFLGKSYTKYDRKTFPRPFSKKSKLSIFLDQYLAYCMPSWELSRYIELKLQTTSFYLK